MTKGSSSASCQWILQPHSCTMGRNPPHIMRWLSKMGVILSANARTRGSCIAFALQASRTSREG